MADSGSGALNCYGSRSDPFTGSVGLRIGAIFIIAATSACTTLFPVITKRVPRAHVHPAVFEFAKYFGSGVIIATAFMHLLSPGVEELHSPCLNSTFQNYDFAFAFAMISMFMLFIVELLAFRIGSKFAQRLAYDPHQGGHHHAAEHTGAQPQAVPAGAFVAATDPEAITPAPLADAKDKELGASSSESPSASRYQDDGEDGTVYGDELDGLSPTAKSGSAAASQILGVMILEFGVVFHSVIIGITLGTTRDFNQLFIVIIFHQMFEGLGLGARLAFLPLRRRSPIPFLGGLAYALVTPIGLAVGLGIRNTYNEDSATANYVTGTFDSVSAGILLYTGLVELLAHEFIFNDKMKKAPLGQVCIAVAEMLTGAGVMALLAKWA